LARAPALGHSTEGKAKPFGSAILEK
jgi:hypothetical protein